MKTLYSPKRLPSGILYIFKSKIACSPGTSSLSTSALFQPLNVPRATEVPTIERVLSVKIANNKKLHSRRSLRPPETGTSADRDDYGDTFRPGSLEREGDQLSLEATTRRSRRRVEHRWFFL
ncbi:hypothetical protein J6590_066460 [Homalodisca vitripennis]|nr:hypothetical protein J6590_066460 [Homalodisca vitripennis]